MRSASPQRSRVRFPSGIKMTTAAVKRVAHIFAGEFLGVRENLFPQFYRFARIIGRHRFFRGRDEHFSGARRRRFRWRRCACIAMVVLGTRADLHNSDLAICSDYVVGEVEEVHFSLQYGRSYEPIPSPRDARKRLSDTTVVWPAWSARSNARGKVQRCPTTISYHPPGA